MLSKSDFVPKCIDNFDDVFCKYSFAYEGAARRDLKHLRVAGFMERKSVRVAYKRCVYYVP